jgi:peptide/nickel transport system substrate-binding protein
VRRVEGQLIELAANHEFFLGRPGIERVIVRVASSPDARINLVLAGDADATESVIPPLTNYPRVKAAPHLRMVQVPSNNLGYLLFNQRDPSDTSRPHPILVDRDVRRALILALDRDVMVKAVLGDFGYVPFGPVTAQWWIRHGAPRPVSQDQSAARRLLAGLGWVDRDGDGVRENRSGAPLSLGLLLPGSSVSRVQLAVMIQEQLRQVGVDLDVVRREPKVWLERRAAGQFDIEFSAPSMDPTPSSLVNSWTCRGGTNVAGYCDPGADSLLQRAIATSDADAGAWHAFLRRLEDNAPAAFLYAQTYVYGVDRRFQDVNIRPESSWLALWRWTAPRS